MHSERPIETVTPFGILARNKRMQVIAILQVDSFGIDATTDRAVAQLVIAVAG